MNTGISIAEEKNSKKWGMIVTVTFHAIIITLLMLFVVTEPDPPLTASEGMVVNLGYVDESTGDIQPMSDEAEPEPIITQKELKANVAANQKIVTQSIEETEAVQSAENATENNTNPTENNTETTEEPQKEQPQVNPVAIYKGKKNNSTSQGTSDKGTGDQGDPNGSPNSNQYGKNTGNGTTPGGGGTGKGISFNLKERKAEMLAKPNYDCNETGTVVVEITVDQKGNVIKATPGARGSTTANGCLYAKAKEAALRTRFNDNSDAPEEQRGFINYNFTLK